MAEYKDTDAILKEIYRRANCSRVGETTVPHLDWKEVVSIINDAPTADVVKVVRCEDCTWYIGMRCGNPFGLKSDHIIPSEFCNNGERK